MAKFESQERRMPKIEACLKANGLESLDACREMLLSKGIDVDAIVKGVQPICFENAVWAYTLGTAIAVKRGLKSAADCAAAIGEGLEAFTIPGSVAEQRAVGLGHGNLGAMLLRDETKCFAFLAGHESFAAAEGAIGIARTANKARKEPLRVILNGLGKDAAYIISRINGFTYVETDYDFKTGELTVVREKAFSDGGALAVRLGKIRLCIQLVLFLHNGVQPRAAAQHHIHHGVVFIAEMVLLQHAHAVVRPKGNAAGGGLQFTGQNAQERRLSRAVRADDAVAVAGGKFQVYMLIQRARGKLQAHVGDGQHVILPFQMPRAAAGGGLSSYMF